jgi:hypothetical protein
MTHREAATPCPYADPNCYCQSAEYEAILDMESLKQDEIAQEYRRQATHDEAVRQLYESGWMPDGG